MSVVKLEYTKTFEDTVDSAISHYSQWHDEITIIERIEAVIEQGLITLFDQYRK